MTRLNIFFFPSGIIIHKKYRGPNLTKKPIERVPKTILNNKIKPKSPHIGPIYKGPSQHATLLRFSPEDETCRNLDSKTWHTSRNPSPPPPKRTRRKTGRRFTGPCRELNGVSPDLAGSKRLPKLTTSSPLLLFTGERQNEKSRPHPETKPSPKRLEIPRSPSCAITT